MMKEDVKYVDEHHLWYKGRQFISLDRFSQLRWDASKEMMLLINQVDELTKENNALKVLLKKELENDNGDTTI